MADLAAAMARALAAAREGRWSDAASSAAEAVGLRPPATDVPRPPPRGRAADALRRGPVPPPLPRPVQVFSRHERTVAGSRDYRLVVPGTTVRGLVVMLHGCRQTPVDFAAGTGMDDLAARHGLVVAYPGQSWRANPRLCWNWFARANQRAGSGEPSIIVAIADRLGAEYGIGPERTFVAGLSAGGAMTATLATTYADRFAAVGIHSGVPYGTAHDVASAYAAMSGAGPASLAPDHPPFIVFQGTADRTVAPANANAFLAAAGAEPGARRTRDRRDGPRPATVERVSVAGRVRCEVWLVEGLGHAWSGGSPAGSFTDVGPDASAEMVRFFLER